MSGGPLGSAGGACWLVGLAGLMNLLGLVDLLCHLLLFLAFLSDPKVFSNGSTIFHDQKEFDGLQVISDEIIYLTLMIQMNSTIANQKYGLIQESTVVPPFSMVLYYIILDIVFDTHGNSC